MRLMLLALALLLAGCTSEVVGRAKPDPVALKRLQEERNTPLTSQLALGDLTTIDYCSLLDFAAIGKGGGIDVDQPLSSFDQCSVFAKVDGRSAQVQIGYLDDKDSRWAGTRIPDSREKLPRGLVKQRSYDAGPNGCFLYLAFPDGIALRVSTTSDSTSSTGSRVPVGSLCTVSDYVFEGVVSAVTEAKVAHLTFAPGSLGATDACDLLSEEQVGAELGVPAPKTQQPSEHGCRWAAASGGPSVYLNFNVGQPLPPSGGTTEETLGNRKSRVQPLVPSFCLLSTDLGPFPGAKNGEVQGATFWVETLSGGKDPCAIGRALANAAWPKLPAG